MARTITEIKNELTTSFISNSTIISLYGLTPGLTFDEQFSVASLENIIFNIISIAISTHEKIVSTNAENSRPHTIRWYQQQCLNFLDGLPLTWLNGQFQYDLTNVTDAAVRKIIDRCAILESGNGELIVKIATFNGLALDPLSNEQRDRFIAYMRQIKDAGNRIRVINQEADMLVMNLTVYVDPLMIDLTTGQLLSNPTIVPVKAALDSYLANLEFNGAFVKEYFIDSLQKAQGVKLPVINQLFSRYLGFPNVAITNWVVPQAGYFKYQDSEIEITYLPYELG